MRNKKNFDPKVLNMASRDLFFGKSLVEYKKLGTNFDKALRFKGTYSKSRSAILQQKDENRHPKECCSKVLISPDSKFKKWFDTLMSILLIYSTVTTFYYQAFKNEENFIFTFIKYVVDILLLGDLISKFFVTYLDPETSLSVKNLLLICKQHITTFGFYLDLVALVPWWFFHKQLALLKLFRIIKLPKATNIFSSNKFEILVVYIYSCKTKNKSKSGHENMGIKYISRYCYKIISLIMFALMLTYFCGCLWYMISKWNPFNYTDTFAEGFELPSKSAFHRLVVCSYFALTTLSTVGYGELYPLNNMEKVIAIILMIVGIAFFSYIMGNFNDILINYDEKMGVVDRGSDLQVWLTSLSKFTSQKPLPRSLVKKIDQHFRFFWNNDRLSDICSDDEYLQLLPRDLRFKLITYIFDDVYHTFRGFFLQKEFPDFPMKYFFYKVAFYLLPRKVEDKEIIIKQGDDVNEVYFLLEGGVEIQFDTHYGEVKRYFEKGFYFGDYYMLFDTPADYNVRAISQVHLLALPKSKLQDLTGKYKAIYDKMLSNTIKNSASTTKALQVSLKEKMKQNFKENNIDETVTDKMVMEEYEKSVKVKAKKIRTKRIQEKNRELYKNSLDGIGSPRSMKNDENKRNIVDNSKRRFTKNILELESIAKDINNLKLKLEKTL